MRMIVIMMLCAVASAGADVRVAAVFTDGMVLQRETNVPIWGWAMPGEIITVDADWDGPVRRVTTDDRGRWRTDLPTPEAGGPYTISIQGDTRITLSDVLIGEVWLCSGQSNMEMPLGNIRPGYTGVDNAEEEIAQAAHPSIRLLTVPNTVSLHPRSGLQMTWQTCSPETARTFSATAYFFARHLHRELGVPIGVISADWGGTRIEAWMSPEAIGAFDAYADTVADLALLAHPTARMSLMGDLEARWWRRLDDRAPGGASWKLPETAVDGWKTMTLPSTLDGELADFDGILYLRRSVELDGEWAGEPALLTLGPIDDMDDVWVNGVHVGSVHEPGFWHEPRRYKIPAGVLVAGENVIAIRVYDTSGPGGVNGEPDQMAVRSVGREVSLAGPWAWAKGASAGELPAVASANVGPNTPTALFHGMIEPVSPFAVRGTIWYQGESNRANASIYDALMGAMIADWRREFEHDDMPFYYVQIAPYGYRGDQGQTAALREAQRRAISTPHTGMVVTMDIGDERDIHPTNKQDVGHRLALWALKHTYDRPDVVCSGPTVRAARPAGEGVALSFEHQDGLELRDGTAIFEVAGDDGVFHPARAGVVNGVLMLRCDAVDRPAEVRYGWAPAATATLFNREGLPASPFLVSIDR